MNHTINITVLLGILLIAACQKHPAASDNEKLGAITNKPTQSTQSVSQQTTPTQSSVSAASQTQPTPVAEKIDLSQAHDINLDKDLSYLTPLFLAKTTRQMTDDQKLALISPEYYNERDSFKKRDLAARLLPAMQQQFEKYKGTYIAKVPIFSGQIEGDKFIQQQKNKNLSVFAANIFSINTATPYNFTNKTFALICDLDKFISQDIYGRTGYFNGNKQGISMSYLKTVGNNGQQTVPTPQEKCELSVPDETIARKIEEAKSKNILGSRGEFYLQISADNNELIAKPLQATITYLNSQTNETLATKEFHW